MSDSVTPGVDPAPDPETAVVNVIEGVITLLGIVGVVVPAPFTKLATIQLVVGTLFAVGGSLATLWSHYRTKTHLQAVKRQLVNAHREIRMMKTAARPMSGSVERSK